MHFLIAGGTGFLGSRLTARLREAGHSVVTVSRRPAPSARTQDDRPGTHVQLDMSQAELGDWLPLLREVDAVVNAAGIFRETANATFALQLRAAQTLADACVHAGVRRVVQLSAIGADASADTAFHRAKLAADTHLLSLPLDGIVVQPSLVFDAQGPSARLFLTLAALPVVPLPAGGRQLLQPVHLDDAVAALQALLEAPAPAAASRCVPLVGPQPLMLRDYPLSLRRGLGLRRGHTWRVPGQLVRWLAAAGDRLPGLPLHSEAWAMLERGNVGNAQAIAQLLGRPARPVRRFLCDEPVAALRQQLQLLWLQPLLRASLAVLWLWTAAVSAGLFPVEQSLQLLARAGVPGPLQAPTLYAAAALNFVLGVLTLCSFRGRRWLWLGQGVLIVLYTAVISLRLPEYWLHPYGPLSKNLPILALLVLLWDLEPRRNRKPRSESD